MGEPKSRRRKHSADEDPSSNRPLKKRNGVTAGIARAAEPEHTHVGNGRNDDSSVS